MLHNTHLHLRFCSDLDVSVETLFAFHTDPENLAKITPPWIDVRLLSVKPPIQRGSVIHLDIQRFGVTQHWQIEIAAFKTGRLITDHALSSPFRDFTHHHRFHAIGDTKSVLCDEINIELPWYPLSILLRPWITRDIQKMFNYRHQRTKSILEKKHV